MAATLEPPTRVVLDREPNIAHKIVGGAIGCTGEMIAGIGPDRVTPVREPVPADGSLFLCNKPGCCPQDQSSTNDNTCPRCEVPTTVGKPCVNCGHTDSPD
ncbi:MAG: hypothetical protein OEV37_02575 [Candidatus Berkelbacteria bacterium]|nr:hypothetical protein [Candidatus Berkelbacteria bacterium]